MSIAASASVCASTSEAALLVASFMPISWIWARLIVARERLRRSEFYSETPRDEYSLLTSPHSANIDRYRIDE